MLCNRLADCIAFFVFQNLKYEFFNVPTERAAIASGNDLRGLGRITNNHLAGIPGAEILPNTLSYVRLHCLRFAARFFNKNY